MAISAISAIGSGASFIPPPVVPPALSPAESFVQALDTSLNNSTSAVNGLAAANGQNNFISALERALFSNWIASVQSANLNTLSPIIDSVLAGQLGVTGRIDANTPALPFDTDSPASLVLTARILSLFSTMQLLGTDINTAPAIGSLLNIAA
jgi:hypothetical protein